MKKTYHLNAVAANITTVNHGLVFAKKYVQLETQQSNWLLIFIIIVELPVSSTVSSAIQIICTQKWVTLAQLET